MTTPHWFTETQADIPTSQLPRSALDPALASFLLGVSVTCDALAFDRGKIEEFASVTCDRRTELDGAASATRLVGADAGGGAFEGAMGLDGRLDNGEHDDHSLSGVDDSALRLSECTAAGLLGVGWDTEAEGFGVSFSLPFDCTLAFPVCSGEEELPFSGDDRCFPVAEYRYFMFFDPRVLGSPKGCEAGSLSERFASSSERPGESISCPAKFADARLAALRAGSLRSDRLPLLSGLFDMDHEHARGVVEYGTDGFG